MLIAPYRATAIDFTFGMHAPSDSPGMAHEKIFKTEGVVRVT